MPGAFGTADEATLQAAAAAEPGTDGVDLVATVTTRRALHGRRRARAGSWPTTSASRRTILRHLGELATVEVVPGVDAGRRRPRPRARRRVPVQRPRRPGRGRRTRSTPSAACSARCRCSASASATSCWPPPSAARPTSCRSATTAATTRCGASRPAAVEITSQNHNYAVAEGSVPGAEVTHVNLNDGVIEGIRCRDVPRVQRAVPPRGRPRPARRPLPVRRVRAS